MPSRRRNDTQRPAAIRLQRRLRIGRTNCSWHGALSTGVIWTTGCRPSGNYWTRLAPGVSLTQICDPRMSSRSRHRVPDVPREGEAHACY
jgi:hypothetical protein